MKNKFSNNIFLLILGALMINTSISLASDSIVIDPGIRFGKLANGFTYYIKPLANTSADIEMKLLVKVGFNQEKRDEFGFAHVVEHLGFTGGSRFSREKSSQLLNQAGFALADLQAHVFNNYTSYNATVPKKGKGINLILHFFQEILGNLELNEKNIDLERIAIINEDDGGNFLDFRFLQGSMEKELTGRGAKIPDDYMKYMNTFKSEDIRNFYDTWYRPDMTSLVITGNVQNLDALENEIKRMFSLETPKRKNFCTVNTLKKYSNRDSQFLKRELNDTANNLGIRPVDIRLFYKQKTGEDKTINHSLEDRIVEDLFLNLLDQRYRNQLQGYNNFYEIRTSFLDSSYAMKLDIIAKTGLKKEDLIKTQRVLNEIKLNGFTEQEFKVEKEEFLSSMKKEDTLNSKYWQEEIINHFIHGENLPANKKQVLNNILKTLSLKDFNSRIDSYIHNQPNDITLAAYSGDPALDFSEEELRNWFLEATEENSPPYTISKIPQHLLTSNEMEALNKASAIEKSTNIPGARKFHLGNGITLVLKSSPIGSINSKNRIWVRSFSPKGINCFPKESYFSALNAPLILMNSGVGRLDKFELKQYLDSINFSGYLQPYIENSESGIRGLFSSGDMEAALQQVYLFFTAPRFNTRAIKDWKMSTRLNSLYLDIPREDFITNIHDVLPDDHYIPQGTRYINGLNHTKLALARGTYKWMFQNPSNFTFLISGDFDEENVLRLCRQYLGNIPLVENNESEYRCLKDIKNNSLPETSVSRTFISPSPMNISLIRIYYTKKLPYSEYGWKEEIKVELLRRILGELLYKKLRFGSNKGGTYLIMAGGKFVKSHDYHQIFIDFSCLPKDVNRLIKESKQVVDSLKDYSVDSSIFQKLKSSMIGDENELAKMYDYIKEDGMWLEPLEKQSFIDSLTINDLQDTAIKYLSDKPFEFKMVSAK